MPVCNRFHERLANNNDFYEGYCSLMPSCASILEPRKPRFGPSKSTFNAENFTRSLGGNREPVYDFLLVIISNLGSRPYLAPLLRYSDVLAKNRKFSYPCHLVPSFGVTPFEFMEKLYGS